MDHGDRTLANSNNFANKLSIYSTNAPETEIVPAFDDGKGVFGVILAGEVNQLPSMLLRSTVPIEHVSLVVGEVQGLGQSTVTITWGPIVEGTLLRNKMLTLSNKPALQPEPQGEGQTYNVNAQFTDAVSVDSLDHMHVSSKYYHSDEWGIEIALGGVDNPAIPGAAIGGKVFKGKIRVMV